jgi:hypothetical protein
VEVARCFCCAFPDLVARVVAVGATFARPLAEQAPEANLIEVPDGDQQPASIRLP